MFQWLRWDHITRRGITTAINWEKGKGRVQPTSGEHTIDRSVKMMRFGFSILALTSKCIDLLQTRGKDNIKRWQCNSKCHLWDYCPPDACSLSLSDTTNGIGEDGIFDSCHLPSLALSSLTYIKSRVVIVSFHSTFTELNNSITCLVWVSSFLLCYQQADD